MNNQMTEQFTKNTQDVLNSAQELMNHSLNTVEKITQLHYNASRNLFSNTANLLKNMLSVNNSKDAADKLHQFANDTVECNLATCRDSYEELTSLNSKVGMAMESHFNNIREHIGNATEHFAGLTPNKYSAVTDSMKSLLGGANQTIDTITKMAGQMAEFANNNIKAATNMASSAVKKATDAATSTSKK